LHVYLQGNTAVYLLYALARIFAIIRKSGKSIDELKQVASFAFFLGLVFFLWVSSLGVDREVRLLSVALAEQCLSDSNVNDL
jgi:hypothetical protein